ncbi:formate dehydrogenase accessory sulfurtransferase FdhD [Membranihabitans marinus]|uniref:formate dehydrogenase accessory sulfurtransferase FdhD n=1 Tax=Membranihabitans marinus TaxID=1227546 RepID=UPI001F29A798|nr:formate dehydrogenase accessory sulfurtransferase FdhD [Membranihabitans marinus]
MSNSSTIIKSITTIRGGHAELKQDSLTIEEALVIKVSVPTAQPPIEGKNISIVMRTPGADVDLALGFLFTEGILTTFSQVNDVRMMGSSIEVVLNESEDIDFSKNEKRFYKLIRRGVSRKVNIESIKSVCSLDLTTGSMRIGKGLILGFPRRLRSGQRVYNDLESLYAAALFDQGGRLLSFREDLESHYALDKLIGHYFQEGKSLLNSGILFLNGGVGFELIQKAAMAGIQMVLASGSPSSLAVDLAREFDITLIGCLKADRYNIYHDSGRVVIEDDMI